MRTIPNAPPLGLAGRGGGVMPCATSQDGTLTICYTGPMKRTEHGRERRARWCFTCRKRARHLKVTLSEILRYTDDGELINGYYDPIFKLECPTCHKENIYFPGCEPTGCEPI